MCAFVGRGEQPGGWRRRRGRGQRGQPRQAAARVQRVSAAHAFPYKTGRVICRYLFGVKCCCFPLVILYLGGRYLIPWRECAGGGGSVPRAASMQLAGPQDASPRRRTRCCCCHLFRCSAVDLHLLCSNYEASPTRRIVARSSRLLTSTKTLYSRSCSLSSAPASWLWV